MQNASANAKLQRHVMIASAHRADRRIERARMHQSMLEVEEEVADACRRFGVRRLAVFGSAARGFDFDRNRSDADLLVEFDRSSGPDRYPALKAELERLFGRPVDLLDKEALDESRNYIRRAAILGDAEVIFEA